MPRSARLVSSLVLVIAGAIASCDANDIAGGSSSPGASGAGALPEVGVVTVEPRRAVLTTELPGRTLPFAVSDVRPQVSGILKARLFTEGSQVQAGQPLYQIDDAPYLAEFNRARAQLANAKAALTTARLRAERYTSLRKDKMISQQDHDEAQAALEQAQATVEQQQAELDAARINLGYTRITAPISGKISRSFLTQGALVEANQEQALARIQTLDPIYVDMNQSTSELLALRRALAAGRLSGATDDSAPVILTLDDGTRYPLEGRLQFSEVTVDETTGTVTLRAEFPNPDGVLLPGMFVRAIVVEGIEPDALLVPQRGITRDERGNPTALIVDADGVVQRRMLDVAQTVGPDWLVESGIRAGDRVIVEGLQFVRPGQKVSAAPFDAPDAASATAAAPPR